MTAASIGPIWTLQARDSVMLEVIETYFDLSHEAMRTEILSAWRTTLDILKAKGVPYESLRNALVPQRDRAEIGLIFDSARIDSAWYGYAVADRVVPLLPQPLLCSLRSGDLILEDQDLASELLETHAVAHRRAEFAHSSQLYCVYVNNLSQQMVRHITSGLQNYAPFVGYVDVSTSSRMKDWLSMILVHAYLKAGRVILNSHEDDVPNTENQNTLGWPWEKHDYRVQSFQDMYFHLFLEYKIERRVVPGFESDTRFALTAVSERPLPLAELPVAVGEAKADYLRTHHGGSLARAGLERIGDAELANVIRAKISESYIYYLRYLTDSETTLFNIMLEMRHPENEEVVTRLLAGLEYRPEVPELSLVTLY